MRCKHSDLAECFIAAPRFFLTPARCLERFRAHLVGNYSWPGSLAGIRIGLDLLAEVSALIVSSGRSANRFPAAGNGPRLAPSPGATSGSISSRLAPASLG